MFVHMVGDILTSHARTIVQGVNREGKMWSGIARVFADLNPEMEEEYMKACRDGVLDEEPFIVGHVIAPSGRGFILFNAVTQDKRGANADLTLMETSLRAVFTVVAQAGGIGIAVPRIGAGVGGLDWERESRPLIERLAGEFPELRVEIWSLPDA